MLPPLCEATHTQPATYFIRSKEDHIGGKYQCYGKTFSHFLFQIQFPVGFLDQVTGKFSEEKEKTKSEKIKADRTWRAGDIT